MESYLDFDLLFKRTDAGYHAQVLNSPAGQAGADFSMPFSRDEIEILLLRIGRPRRGTRRIDSPQMEAVKVFGRRLFEAAFGGEIRACFRSSLDEAQRQDAGLRIRLRLSDTPELVDLPWEYLYNPSLNRFFSLSAETPLVRYLELPERIRPLEVQAPLRLLAMVASPSDYPDLDAELEWSKLKEALAGLEQQERIVLERLPEASLSCLQRRLRREAFHIFHFIGHGGFDSQAEDGVLILEDSHGRGHTVSGQYLGTLLHDHRPLRLAVLNACEGARTGRSDPFSGTAQSLMQQGIAAVIAMQFEITDRAAITFAHEFYSVVADGSPIDTALAEARRAIFAQGNDVEWGTPVLYLRAPDGHIFNVSRAKPAEAHEAPPELAHGHAKSTALLRKRTVIEKLANAKTWTISVVLGVVALIAATSFFWDKLPIRGTAKDAVSSTPARISETASAKPALPADIAEEQFRKGEQYASGDGVVKNEAEAVKLFRQAAAQGHAGAQTSLGLMYADGRGLIKDEALAVKFYQQAAAQGYARGQHYLGVMYAEGRGVARNDTDAVGLFKQAAARGYDRAQNYLGVMYEDGRGAAKDEAEAVKFYQRAAAQGNARAQSNLGRMYADGRGVAKNEAEAVKLYRQAAAQGDSRGQHNLGRVYAEGRGVTRDDAEAVKWFKLAAAQEYDRAQNYLGLMYANGRGVAKDEVQAVKLYQQAARNYSFAQSNLAVMYANGRGVAKDEAKAAELFRLAAKQGNEFAQGELRKRGLGW